MQETLIGEDDILTGDEQTWVKSQQ